jgi:outer membrane protein
MKKLVAVSVLALGAIAARAAAAELKIAYVDMQRAVKEVEEGKRAFKKLRRAFNKFQKQIRKKEEEVKRFQEDLKQQSLVLTDDAKKQKQAEFQRKLMEFQTLYLEKQKDLQQRESKLMGPIIARLVKVVQEIGQTGEYTAVFEKTDSRLLFAQPSLDLTNEVIRRYNARKKGGKKKK